MQGWLLLQLSFQPFHRELAKPIPPFLLQPPGSSAQSALLSCSGKTECLKGSEGNKDVGNFTTGN